MGLPRAFDALRDERVWVAWADEGGRKVPKSPHGGNARSNDPSTWGTYAEAEAVRAANGYSGVGLMLTDGYVGIDLDNVVGEDGAIADWARDVIDELGSYAEFSPSGTGVHVIAWADPEQTGPIGRADHGKGIEAYNHGRYFTVTGDELPGEGSIRDVTRALPEFVSRHFSGESPEQAVRRRIGDLARDQVKRQANRTMAENCARDGVRYARVPRGSETCGFCIMLASRGYVYTTPDAAQHSHDGCDCKVMPGFDGAEVEGYDPGPMLDAYSDCYDTLGGRQGIRRMWDTLPEDERAKRIAKHDGSESDAFDSFAAYQVSKEIEIRDPLWVRTGEHSGIEFSDSGVKSEKERRWKDDPGERITAEKLNLLGYRAEFWDDEIHEQDPSGKGTVTYSRPDLSTGIELKTVYRAASENTFKTHMKSCSKKHGLRFPVFDISENNNVNPEDALRWIEKYMSVYSIREVRVIGRGGSIKRIVK